MALIVAPAEGYNSFVTLAEADAYHAGATAWSGAAPEAREAALRKGTLYVRSRRVRVVHLDPVVHENVKAAACEAALRALDGTLYADQPAQAVVSESVGPLSVTYSDPRNGGRPRFPVIDDLLAGLTAGTLTLPVVRS